MTVLWGDTGKVAVGPLRTFNIALATPRESLIATPVALPSAEPTTAQVSVTIQASDLPTITPEAIGVTYTAILYAAGKNADAAAQTVNWRVLKNGVSVATGTSSSVPATQFWTHAYYQFLNVVAGDVLEVKLWSASANVNHDYYAIVVYPTKMNLSNAYMNKDVSYSSYTTAALSLGTPLVNSNQQFNFYPSDAINLSLGSSSVVNFGAMRWNQTYFAGRVQWGDFQIATQTQAHATARPIYGRNNVPSTISFREVLR